MTIIEKMKLFSDHYRKKVTVNGTAWYYHRLGTGTPILWLTGGLRRTAIGFPFLERLAQRHIVLAPDYPPVKTIGEYL